MKTYQPLAFKWRHFHGEVILQCVRWYCRYGISYRDLEEMMRERGLSIDHTTLYRFVQHYAPELKKNIAWYQKYYCHVWFLDEIYVKVKGEWNYLYRAIDEQGKMKVLLLMNCLVFMHELHSLPDLNVNEINFATEPVFEDLRCH